MRLLDFVVELEGVLDANVSDAREEREKSYKLAVVELRHDF